MKYYLVTFFCQSGDYEHHTHYATDKKKSDWQYCKEFWDIEKKNPLDEASNAYWDDFGMNSIKVYSVQEIKPAMYQQLKTLRIA
jgi:hypothetical protein